MPKQDIAEKAGKLGLSFRRLTHQDLDGALSLSIRVGWNQITDDWRIFLDRGTAWGLFEMDSQLIATAAILPFPPDIAWISMVIVHPNRRRQGLATALVRECLAQIDQLGLTTGLDASDEGAQVYQAIGFQRSEKIIRCVRPTIRSSPPETGKTPGPRIAENDFCRIERCDREWSGIARGFLLKSMIARFPEATYGKFDPTETSQVYGFARRGHASTQIGPIGSSNPESAKRLLDELGAELEGSLCIDVPLRHKGFIDHLEKNGWQPTRPFTRMFLGNYRPPPMENIYAIIGPEFS